MISLSRHGQWLRVSRWQPSLSTASFIQLEFAVNPVNTLMIPAMAPTMQDFVQLAESISRITLSGFNQFGDDPIITRLIRLVTIN